MISLPQPHRPSPGESHGCGRECGTSCGAGLEKIYPVTAVRYGAMSWLGEFRYKPGNVFKCGAKVVIQSDRGIELGQQVSLSCNGCSKQVTRDQIKAYIDASGIEFYKLSSGYIVREATPADIDEGRHLNAHLQEDVQHCAELADRMGLDIKIVTAEHLLGGERVVYYFRSEVRVDFRGLVRELAHHHRTRIEMRQVGARDEARLVADYEVCGREVCCKNFLKKLRPVTMRMAKLQKSTLDPSKVSGRCGRLRCCLRYEHIGYEELNAKLPPIGSLVETALGPADVVDRQVLTQLLLVRLPDEKQVTVPFEEVKSVTLPKDRTTRTVVPERPEPPERGDGARRPDDRRRRDADPRRGDGPRRDDGRRDDRSRGPAGPRREDDGRRGGDFGRDDGTRRADEAARADLARRDEPVNRGDEARREPSPAQDDRPAISDVFNAGTSAPAEAPPPLAPDMSPPSDAGPDAGRSAAAPDRGGPPQSEHRRRRDRRRGRRGRDGGRGPGGDGERPDLRDRPADAARGGSANPPGTRDETTDRAGRRDVESDAGDSAGREAGRADRDASGGGATPGDGAGRSEHRHRRRRRRRGGRGTSPPADGGAPPPPSEPS